TLLESRAHAVGFAGLGGLVEPALADRAQGFGQRLARGLTRAFARERFHAALELADVQEVDAHLELVEQRAHVHDLRGDADGLRLASGAEPGARASAQSEGGAGVA